MADKRIYLFRLWVLLIVIVLSNNTAHMGISSSVDLVYVGADYNIYSTNLDNNVTYTITTDGNFNRRYQWPTVSRDSRLAYFCCDPAYVQNPQNLRAEIFISSDLQSAGRKVYDSLNQGAIYAYWSPIACRKGINCWDLAVLINDYLANSLKIELIRNVDDSINNQSLGFGSPFYYSWSPDGSQMVWHRNNNTLDIYDIDKASITNNLSESPSLFLSPAWSPVDDRILLAQRVDENRSELVIVANGQTQTLATDLSGLISFAWSPDGNYIAYRTITREQIGPLLILDAISGAIVARSNIDNVIAFFWSPDSTKIAYVTLTTPPGTFNTQAFNTISIQNNADFSWNIIQLNGVNIPYNAFIPTPEMQYLLLYFDQFSQSHRIWSSDSRHIVYSELADIDARQSIISILDVSKVDSVPLSIANGVFAIWSFQ